MPTKHVSGKALSLRTVLNDPALPELVRSLPARDLAQLCGRIGIFDATHIMALAPAERLVQALEASVWKTPRPGLSEVFDAGELVEWIQAWLEIGERFTAERLAAVPDESLLLYLSQLANVSTGPMWGFERSTEIEDLDRIYAPSYDETAFGPYVVSARQQDHWETLRGSLDAMWMDAPERLLHLFAQLVGDESMIAPQCARETSNYDFVAGRESVRERAGYVTANGARAFLAQARSSLDDLAAMSDYDLETRRHLAGLANEPAHDAESTDSADGPTNGSPDGSDLSADNLAALHFTLEAAGLLAPPPQRLLLVHDTAFEPLQIVKLLQALAEKDEVQFNARARELAYLGSVLVAGIAIEATALSPAEARKAALATCNLGLELLYSHGERARIDQEPGLVRLFLVGFNALSGMPGRVAQSFARRLTALRKAGSEPLHEWLVEQAEVFVADLIEAVRKGNLAAARDAVTALCFVFESRACQAITPLLDELPRLAPERGEAAKWIDSMAAFGAAAALLRGITAKRGRVRAPP
ncbi:MAG TPA: DUF6178 family protein [Steroidobacteraceae bacterium]|nr:DUF6178 family protein [Steroidobacteraceae bacterium]